MYFDLLWGYFKSHPWDLVILVVARLILYFLEIVVLSYLASNLIFSVKNSHEIRKSIFLFVIAFCTVAFLWFCVEAFNSFVIPSIQDYVRKQILTSVFYDNKAYDLPSVGSTINNLSRIPHLVYVQMISISYYIMPFLFTFLFLFLFFFYRYGRQIGMVFMIIMLVLFVVFGVWFKEVVRVSIERYNSELLLSEKFDDALINSEQIMNDNLTQATLEEVDRQEQEYSALLHKELMCMNAWKQSLDMFVILTMGIVLFLGFRQYQSKTMGSAVFTSLATVVLFIINRIISLINRIGDIPYIMGGISVSESMMEDKKKMMGQKGTRTNFVSGKNISVRGLNYSYPNGQHILKNVDMDIPFRSSHVIRGESGSGKTTLCRCLMGYFPIPHGKIMMDGVSLDDVDPVYWRENVSIMTQNGFLLDTTGMENISKDPNIQERVKHLPIYPRIESLLERRVGKLGSKLSGGEKQILLLLRALFRPSFLLILDEPTSNIDDRNKKTIMEILQEVKKYKSVVCVTHDDDIVPLFDNVYTMSDQRLQFQ